MQQHESGWQDFLCANHSRNLHFDSFARGFTAYTIHLLGDLLTAAKAKSGGRLRIEPDGESFIRSICKLTHVGPKQYEKGGPYPNSYPNLPNPDPSPNPLPNPNPKLNPLPMASILPLALT